MTIEELAKLKPGDKVMCGDWVLTFDHVEAVVFDSRQEKYHLDIQALRVTPGPTLPPHVAEIWEWDGSPEGSKLSAGWVWHDSWKWPHFGEDYLNVWRLIPKIRKEAK